MPSYTREELDQHLAETRAALKRESDVDMRNRLRREIDATHEARLDATARFTR